MTDDQHQNDQDEIRSDYAVRPVVYIPLTILLMLVFGFMLFGATGGNIYGAVAGVILAPMVTTVMILGCRFINWFYNFFPDS